MPKRTKQSADTPALSARKERGCAGCFVYVFALGFLGIGSVFFYFLTLRPCYGMFRATGWVQTPCTVVSSKLNGDGDSESLEVVFKYTINNQDHQSDRYCFISISSNTANTWKNQVLRDHPPGKQTTCFVNPRDPTDAVIEPGWVPDMWWGLFPIPFLLIGIGASLIATRVIRISRLNTLPKINWKPAVSTIETTQDAVASDLVGNSDGLVTLTPQSTPVGNLIGALGFAVIWNGALWIIVSAGFPQIQQGQLGALGRFEIVFLTSFVLVGVGTISFVFYTFLTLFNPRPTLTIDSAAIPLGGLMRLSWSLTGRVNSIVQFKISLKGIEKATYRRGTSTSTDTATFAVISIFETTEMFDMAEGSVEFTVPADSMHSFNAPSNKIEWSLEVHGDIAWWPNMSASFPITILPKRPRENT